MAKVENQIEWIVAYYASRVPVLGAVDRNQRFKYQANYYADECLRRMLGAKKPCHRGRA
jgi:hypothetical protein